MSALGARALEGSLAYMAPEQTGRMNRVVDPRSDLYSLGATLYELLTGVLPFQAADSMAMIHSHIARRTMPPSQRAPGIPQILSDLVMKLLAKAAEDRYQSAAGLKADLQECLQQWQTRGEIAAFPLGRSDLGGALRIPQRLYGRQEATAALLAALDRTSRGAAELLLLSGPAGVGKSALVQEIYKAIAQRSGYFISGKFDQLGRHIPYAPVAQAFRELMRQLLTESPQALDRWTTELLAALGPSGQVLSNLIPELELVIGPQPNLAELGPTESKNRFSLAFQNFLHVCATAEHPLVLFLDDLQWADPASLTLLQILLSDPERGHFLVIGAYRDEEVDAAHPLRLTLDELRKAGATTRECPIRPLELGHVTELLGDTLNADLAAVAPLARLVYEKTQGNPFFLNQFLTALYKDRQLEFDVRRDAWSWDLERIAQAQVTDNVVEFVVAKLRRLTPVAQRLLTLAACIGHQFELDVLSALGDRSPVQTAADLWEAVQEGLIVPLGSDYRFLLSGAGQSADPAGPETGPAIHVVCKFLHDRVQQAAYSLIPQGDKQHVHLRIGRRLRAQRQQAHGDEGLFELVNHLNYGAALITQPEERSDLARLNLLAGQRAKAATAYATAASHFAVGVELLAADSWRSDYELSFVLHAERAECEYLSAHFKEAESLFEVALCHARSLEDQARIYALRIVLYTTLGEFTAAITAGQRGLQLFDVDLPAAEHERKTALDAELAQMESTRAGRSMEELLAAPQMTAPEQLLVSRLLMDLVAPAYFTSPTLFALLATRMVNLTQQHGNCEVSAYGYITYGFLLAAAMGRPAEAYALGRLGLSLQEKFHCKSLDSKLNFVFGIYQHLCSPLRTAMPYLTRALQSGLESGDLTYASFACHHIGFTRLGLGDELSAVREEVDRCLALMQRTKDAVSLRTLLITRQAIKHLQGESAQLLSLNDDSFNEEEFVAAALAAGFPMGCCYFYFTKLQLLYLGGDYPGALAMAHKAEELKWSAFGLYYRTELPLYTSLTLAALYGKASRAEQTRYLEELRRHYEQIATWAQGCPDNFRHQERLVAAELARLEGREAEAMGLYEQAIVAAQQGGFVHHAALASELTAELHLLRQRSSLAGFYLREAQYGYLRWGATAKARQLVEKYPQLGSDGVEPQGFAITETNSTRQSAARTGQLDVATIVRAAQAICSEMVLDKVIDQLMRSVLTNAGAQRGFLLVPQKGVLFIEAAMTTEPDTVQLGLAQPLSADAQLAVSVVHYVARSQETAVLGNASAERRFASDRYIQAAQPKSILCLALLHQGRLPGILYLENNTTFDAFTQERVELLRLLAAQAAIAMENARLYADVQRASQDLRRANENLESQVDQRTEELRAATSRLYSVNDSLTQRSEELRQANQLLQNELGERERAERARAALQEQIINVQKARLSEMSSPIIPITDHIMIMPLIGSMDSARAEQVLSTALDGAQRSGAQVVILDITGMTQMDKSVAETLVNTARALGLLGAHAVLTGIRAGFAQLMVTLGVELGTLVTRGTLQSGIAYALGRTGESTRPGPQRLR